MGNKFKYIGIVAALLTCFSCGQESQLSVPDYLSWVNDPANGLKVAKELSDYRFELFYKPVEYIVVNEQRKWEVNPDVFTDRMEELKGMQYYTLRIESLTGSEMMRTGISTEQEYGLRLQYFSDLAQYDMKLVDGNDTLSCALFHFERNYGIAPYNNIVLGFPKIEGSTAAKTFTFNERVLGVGKVNLKITENDINNIPELILN